MADMLVAKILFNSVISTKGARFMTIDISNLYLMNPHTGPEYISIHIREIPDQIIAEYKLNEKSEANGVVCIVAKYGMYGLPKSGLLSNALLEKGLNKHGCHQAN